MCSKHFCVQAKGGGASPSGPPKYATGSPVLLPVAARRAAICLRCGTTRHVPSSGHETWDVDDTVDKCRSILRQHAAVVTDQHADCLGRIASTNDRVDKIRSKPSRRFYRATICELVSECVDLYSA